MRNFSICIITICFAFFYFNCDLPSQNYQIKESRENIPDFKITDVAVWQLYYKKQFDYYGSRTTMPIDSMPVTAKQGYLLAKDSFEKENQTNILKDIERSLSLISIITSVVTGAGVLLAIITLASTATKK